MVAEDHFGRLQARIYRSPPNQILSDITSPISSNVLSSTGGCVRSVGEKSHKASSSMPRRERILLANLSSTKTRRRLQAYSQPEASQQIHQIQEVQDGQHPLSAEPTTKGCIYDVSGPPRRLLTSTDPSGLTGVPEVCGPSSRRGSFYHLHKGRYVLTRTYDILIPGCPVGPTAFQTAPTVDFAGLEQGSQKSGQKGVHPLLHKNLASVVVGTKSAHSGLPVGLSNPEDHHYRRQQLGVGCSYGQFTNPGDLGQFLEASTLQHQGAGGSETSFVAFSGSDKISACNHQVRQQHSCSLPKSSRGNKEQDHHDESREDPLMGGKEFSFVKSSTSQGYVESSSRLSQQVRTESGQLVPESGSLSRNSVRLGNADNRSFCKQAECQVSDVLFPVPERQALGSGRFLTQMELPSSICVPSFQSDFQDSQQDQPGWFGGNNDRSFLAKEIVVFTAEEASCSGANTAARSPGLADARSSLPPSGKDVASISLDAESELLRGKGFSKDLTETLLLSRKMVTRKIYLKAWRVYNNWCMENSRNREESYSALEFLQSGLKKGLSASTLKVQTAALSVFLQRKLSEDEFFIRFFRAVNRIRPVIRSQVPPWDLNLVLQALMDEPFEPLEEISEKLLTLKTAFLLAISSARRVGEIQALSIAEPYCIISEDRVTLKLDAAFLPKVCSRFHRSQEIYLPSFCNEPSNDKERRLHCLDVRRCVIKYLEVTKPWRKSQALFVLFSGINRGGQASKATIARWIRQAIVLAYQSQGKEIPSIVRAHSTRSISASWAEKAGVSIDQICRAATWSNRNTFVKHYKLDLDSRRDLTFGRRVLHAVVPP
ncbi:uncharacterized protein [Hyperolius riggenbachi]|uniref:uncharacterized protein n=1 Tax=Hyperolius riggenbachi TaxID=752182 RepID=UPI0035A2732C